MAISSAPAVPSRRERLRQQTLADIKEAARRQIGEAGGAGSLSLNALAKSLGMAGPSLYRYFDSRDALLVELIVDGYTELAEALEATSTRTPGRPSSDATALGAELRDYSRCYRHWALANPELYELLFGTPVPGFTAPHVATGPAATRALMPLVELVERLRALGTPPARRSDGPPAVTPSAHWAEVLTSTATDAASFLAAISVWARLHGLLTLEIRGHLGQMVDDPSALFDREIEQVVAELVAPSPPDAPHSGS